VRALQDQLRLTPLSSWGKPAKPAEAVSKPDGTSRTPIAEMESMDSPTFFARLCRLMQQNPPAPADAQLVRRLEEIGIRPDREFDFRRLPSEMQQAVERGVAEAKREMSGPMAGAKMVNGWRMQYHAGTYGVDYLLRAQQARTGIGANLPEDALYPRSITDAEGRPLEGSRCYLVHFDKGLLPPVNEAKCAFSHLRALRRRP
jgi:hypothetical protein